MDKANQKAEKRCAEKRKYEKPRLKVIAVEAYDVLGTCNLMEVGTCFPTQL